MRGFALLPTPGGLAHAIVPGKKGTPSPQAFCTFPLHLIFVRASFVAIDPAAGDDDLILFLLGCFKVNDFQHLYTDMVTHLPLPLECDWQTARRLCIRPVHVSTGE